VQSELATLGKFANACSAMKQIFSADGRRCLHQRLTDIIAPILHESKAVAFIASVDHFLHILSNVFRQLEKQSSRFVFCERSHDDGFR
jgi:hypothetical protein